MKGSPRASASLALVPSVCHAEVDDAQLVAELGDGSLPALARAYDRWHQRVRVLARRLLSDEAAAEDVVQDVFAALPRAAARFRGAAKIETFLLAIAVKRARRHQRSALRRRRALARLADQERPGPRDPERNVYQRELGLRMAEALDRLPLAQRIAFVLCVVEGMTSGQAAAIADVPEATIRTRVHHARLRLRAFLSQEWGE